MRIARDDFGFAGRAHRLPSERDQNFAVESEDGTRIVLKIANATESRAMLEAQQAALDHLVGTGIVPRLIRTRVEEPFTDVQQAKSHLAWAVSWIEGTPLANAPRRSPRLLEDVGRSAAVLRRALDDFDHPAIHRDFYWDLANAPRIVHEKRNLVADAKLRAAIDVVSTEFDRRIGPVLPALRRGALHGDLNDYNVLISGDQVVGIVDYGDMVRSYSVADVAIAIAYIVKDDTDPLAAAARVVLGYHREYPLQAAELKALWGLVLMRLCASACIASEQLTKSPANPYLGVSQQAIQSSLPRLATIPFRLAEATFRAACGMPPVANGARIDDWLRRATIAPILGQDLRVSTCLVLDLGVTSTLVAAEASANAEPALTPRVEDAMRAAHVSVAVGRYNEPRLLYTDAAFSGPTPADEPRTVHIGLDLFAPAGSVVCAPLDGEVHAFADNAAPQDYGPVIVLRHTTDDGTPFYTLYGHLSRGSVAGLHIGQQFKAGQQLARLGAPDVNGGWTPHVHLQILVDDLGLGADFPGVCRASERKVWLALCPDPNLLVRVPSGRFGAPALPLAETAAERRERTGGNLSIAYEAPVKVVRGWKQYLFDDTGRRFIDAYNNVPHVGHSHPRVVDAGIAQMRRVNTNTRYLSDLLTEYASRLSGTLPPSLSVCYFVNSASEANELALRLARAATGTRDMVVLEAAYHGNTTSLIDISPYKHAGPGGSGAPDWVHVAPLPDDYRGAHKRADPDAGPKYAAHVAALIDAMRANGRSLAGFIAETCPSVAGQIVLPPRYLRDVYAAVRTAGGVCIADEVQTGLGRMGTHFWAFEAQAVVPDIVVMGKPLGNGHPLAAVATTRAIADAFDNGMEYFSTFGGNTVSCAIGLAVLDVLRDEQLQAHALDVGRQLLDGLHVLAARHELIGDVRGSGLFLGVELVRDRETLEPAGPEAGAVANRLRERGILLGTDGPHHNVIKIRPPMPFDSGNAEQLLSELETALADIHFCSVSS